MKVIKLSGREMAVLRAIETTGSTGQEIIDRTQILATELADILGAMCEVGYVEGYRANSSLPEVNAIPATEVAGSRFEINPSYAQELKKATRHS